MVRTLEELEEARQRLGISQVEMCKRAEVSESTIAHARSQNRQPTPRIRRKLDAAISAIAAERGVVIVDQIGGGR